MRNAFTFKGLRSTVRGCLFGEGAKPSLAFLAAATLVNLLLVGYEFAVLDQLLYLALVPRYFDPSTINPNDLYLHLFFSRTYTTLFLFLAPFIKVFGWEWPIFIAYILVKFFSFWGIWSLTHWLTRDRRAAAFAVIFLLMNYYMRALSVQFYSINLICRYAVIPFLFFGLKRVWEERYVAAGLLFGLAFQVHAMSTLYWILVTVFCGLCNLRRILGEPAGEPPAVDAGPRAFRLNRSAVRGLLLGGAVFTVLALPLVLWRGLTPMPPPPDDFSRQEWFDFSYNVKHAYVFYSQWGREKLLALGLGGVLFCIPLYRMARDRALRWYLPTGIGVLIVMGVHYLATEVFPFQPVYQLQWLKRMSVFGNESSGRRRHRSGRAYYNMSADQWIELADTYDVRYLVTYRRAKLPFPVLHQEGRLAILQITGKKGP